VCYKNIRQDGFGFLLVKSYNMSKSHDAKKNVKKSPQKTLKEKRLAKKVKKTGK